MATGHIVSYDPEKGEGYVQPDGQDEKLPFALEKEERERFGPFAKGDHVSYDMEGGLAGVMAIHLRQIA